MRSSLWPQNQIRSSAMSMQGKRKVCGKSTGFMFIQHMREKESARNFSKRWNSISGEMELKNIFSIHTSKIKLLSTSTKKPDFTETKNLTEDGTHPALKNSYDCIRTLSLLSSNNLVQLTCHCIDELFGVHKMIILQIIFMY